MGGWAKAEGKLPSLGQLFGLAPAGAAPPASASENTGSPIAFGVGGGIAVFVIVFLLATWVDRYPAETKYNLSITETQVSIPPAHADRDWLVTVEFRVEPIPRSNYSLKLEFSEKPDFKELIGPAMLITSPVVGQAIDQIPAHVGQRAWVRLVLCDMADRDIAFSKILQVK